MSLLDTIMDALGFEPKHQGFDVAEAVHEKANSPPSCNIKATRTIPPR
jgi:hypothetical protein